VFGGLEEPICKHFRLLLPQNTYAHLTAEFDRFEALDCIVRNKGETVSHPSFDVFTLYIYVQSLSFLKSRETFSVLVPIVLSVLYDIKLSISRVIGDRLALPSIQ